MVHCTPCLGTPHPMFGYSMGTIESVKWNPLGKIINVMTPHQIWTNVLLTTYGVCFRTYVKHFATLFKFHWILSKFGRLILHWFTSNFFMVLCSALMEHNLTTKYAHKKYTYVFNIEKYIHINAGNFQFFYCL